MIINGVNEILQQRLIDRKYLMSLSGTLEVKSFIGVMLINLRGGARRPVVNSQKSIFGMFL